MNNKDIPRVVDGRSLIDIVLSWSLNDVLNKNLYKNQVKPIPTTFSSADEYLDSFMTPLIAETHADMSSSAETLSRSRSLCRPIISAKPTKGHFKSPKDLFYDVVFHHANVYDKKKNTFYEPQNGDIFAITTTQPKRPADLAKPYVIAYVVNASDDKDRLSVLTSQPIPELVNAKSLKLFAVYLVNLTTNIRIWQALNSDPKQRNASVVKKILGPREVSGNDCEMCEDVNWEIGEPELNESQMIAVLSCLGMVDCLHESRVKLIWGPPGTGKTKTVGFLLLCLLAMKCRTVACAPTNVAVVQLAERLVRNVVFGNGKLGKYGFGDVVLFGNGDRMKIDDHDELCDVFLDYRVRVLSRCFYTKFGWKEGLVSLLNLLENPEKEYKSYLMVKKLSEEGLLGAPKEEPQTLDEFFMKRFDVFADQVKSCAVNLCTHLPRSVLRLETAKEMNNVVESLESFQILLQKLVDQGVLHRVFDEEDEMARKFSWFREYKKSITTVILELKSLPSDFALPGPVSSNENGTKSMRELILANAIVIFCTVSSSATLNGTSPLEVLIIDEAAQLKECESTIPLQLPGIRHAVLIGDERQLPAMVISKVCEKADFGRSLFERLAGLGHKKHLLNVQHRMHPSISLFPNKEFYENKILDGENVKLRSYSKRFLPGKMFGSFSFINVAHGREAADGKCSSRNFIEVAVVSEIVATLYKEIQCSKKRVRVGVISPYKAQVHAITDAIGEKYSSDAKSDFSVSVRSVDGFQGGEEDVIIISTVRSNGNGNVGFLSNFQRANVALTRARHCLWIVGSGSTLSNNSSVWKRLVVDAKRRDCFHDANEDKNLAQAVAIALIEQNQINTLPNLVSFLSKDEAKWKVLFGDDFWKSMARFQGDEIRKDVLSVVEKLSCGWRQPRKESKPFEESISEFVECCKVKQMWLVWAVEIVIEDSHHVQVLKMWDFLAPSEVPKMSKQVEKLYQRYTLDKMSRCMFRHQERDLVVPMRWSLEDSPERYNSVRFLSRTLASLDLKH